MKYFLFIILFSSCAQSYQTYHIIEKSKFSKDNSYSPITKKLRPGKKTTREYCEGQFLFYTNAKKRTDQYLERLVEVTCPEDKYLLQSKVTETWWTVLLYSKSCVELETYCPRN